MLFFALLRAGLWETDVRLLPFHPINIENIFQISEFQSVIGLVTAGLERVSDISFPKEELFGFIGSSLIIEQRNKAMNNLIGVLVDKMRDVGIYTILVKGQGVAQCYERPLWRTCGDVDFFLRDINFRKRKIF